MGEPLTGGRFPEGVFWISKKMPGSRSLLNSEPNKGSPAQFLSRYKVTVSRDFTRQECIIFPRLYKHTYTQAGLFQTKCSHLGISVQGGT